MTFLNATRSTVERVASSAIGFLTAAEDGAVTLVNITVPIAAFNGSIAGSGAFGTLSVASVTLPGTFHVESPVARIALLAVNVTAAVTTSNDVACDPRFRELREGNGPLRPARWVAL